MVIESSMSTNLHLRECKRLIYQCSLIPFSMLAILIVYLSIGVIEPAEAEKSDEDEEFKICLVWREYFSDSRHVDDWVQCLICKRNWRGYINLSEL